MSTQEITHQYQLPEDTQAMIDAGNAVRAEGGQAYVDALNEERQADRQGLPGAEILPESDKTTETGQAAVAATRPEIPATVRQIIDEHRQQRSFTPRATHRDTILFRSRRG